MKWIKCIDRLPKASYHYDINLVIAASNSDVFPACIDSNDKWTHFHLCNQYCNVIKWMPLPDGDNDEEQ